MHPFAAFGTVLLLAAVTLMVIVMAAETLMVVGLAIWMVNVLVLMMELMMVKDSLAI